MLWSSSGCHATRWSSLVMSGSCRWTPRRPNISSPTPVSTQLWTITSDGRLYIATRGEKHSGVASIVRTLQVLPEQLTPDLYWVVGTKKALSGFHASAMPFADQLNAATQDEDCPEEPSAEFWTSTALELKQVPRKARHLLAKVRQYVMWLDYTRYKK